MKNKKQNKSFLASLLERLSSQTFQNYLVNQLEKEAVKAILKKLVISGGIRGWLISFVVGELVEEADEHLVEPAFRKIGWYSDTLHGKAIYQRKVNAKDRDAWRDAVRNS